MVNIKGYLAGFAKDVQEFGKYVTTWTTGMKPMMNAFKKAYGKEAAEAYKAQGKAWKDKKGLVRAVDLFKEMQLMGKMAVAPFNAMLSVMEMFGVAQPILDAISGVVAVIGGSIMQEMMPAIQEFIGILFSDEMMEVWQLLGEGIGNFLSLVMLALNKILGDPKFQKTLKGLATAFLKVGEVFVFILTAILNVIGGLSAAALGGVIYAMLVFMAFMKGMALGGEVFGVYLGAAFATAAGIASRTMLKQPASCKARASPSILAAELAVLPCTR